MKKSDLPSNKKEPDPHQQKWITVWRSHTKPMIEEGIDFIYRDILRDCKDWVTFRQLMRNREEEVFNLYHQISEHASEFY